MVQDMGNTFRTGVENEDEDDWEGGTPGGVRRRQGVRRPVNIGWNACFQGVRRASEKTLDPSGKKRNIEHATSNAEH